MAVGKNKRMSKGGKKGSKKKVVEAMSRKEWYDIVAPANFKNRQFGKTICNKTQGIKRAEDNLLNRVYEVCLADLTGSTTKDQPFRRYKFIVNDIQGRNLLTQFQGLRTTADKARSLIKKWCTMVEAVVEAKTADGYVLRLFVTAFTVKQDNQLSKNCYAKQHLVKWARSRMTKMIQKRFAKCDINQAVTLLKEDILADNLQRRCNPILPLRDLKIQTVKVIRTPKFDGQKLVDAHGIIPASKEADARIVEEAAPAATTEAE